MKIILKNVRDKTWNTINAGSLQPGMDYCSIDRLIYAMTVDRISNSVWIAIFEEIREISLL